MSTIIAATKVPTTIDTITPFDLLLVCCLLTSQLLATSHKSRLPLTFVTTRKLSGNTPKRLLYETSRFSSGNLLKMEYGISPMKALYERSRTMSFLSSPSSFRIGLISKFVERFSVLRCEQFPNVGGIPPMKAFRLRSSQLSLERSLWCGGIELEKLFPNVEGFCITRRLLIFWGNEPMN